MQTPEQIIRAQRDEIETLREENRQLREALAPRVTLPREWRLTKYEERLIRAIRAVGPNVLHQERVMLALYGMADDAPETKSLETMLCKIRRKLREAGAEVTIETVWARGWRMTPESCAAYDAAVAADRARWPAMRRAA